MIQPDQHYAVWAMLLGLAAFGFWSDTTRWGQRISGVAMMLVVAIVLSNVGVIPKTAPAYGVVWSYLVPLAIPLLLLKADLRKIIPETGPTLVAFLVGTVGTVVGTVFGFWILGFGANESTMAGVFSATYIGGSMNFAAVSEALQFTDSARLSAAVAADNVVGTLYLLILVALPSIAIVTRFLPLKTTAEKEGEAQAAAAAEKSPGALNPVDMSLALTISFVLCALGYGVASLLNVDSYGILFVTAFSVGLANLVPGRMARLRGDFEIGMLFMFIFFATIGAGADIGAMIQHGPALFAFASVIVGIHLLVILIGSSLFRLDLAEVMVASSACVLGPPVAAALAAGRGWPRLVTPGIMCGVLGYAIANFIGVGLAGWLG